MANEKIADDFDRRYRAALAVVMLLVLGDQVLVQPYLMRLTTDAPLINVAGRQRMLSQRLAKAALAYDREGGGPGDAALDEMQKVLDLWTESHERLLRGGPGAGVSEASRQGLAEIGPDFEAMRDGARRVLAAGRAGRRGPESREAVALILDREEKYLQGMDRVVGLYEAEAGGRVESFRRIGWTLTGLTIAALVGIGLFLFRPAATLIRGQVSELERARDELEARVLERTADLEAAQLRHQALLEQVSHVGRTSAVGEMASALAHELNQPLGAIANYAEGCLIALDSPEPDLQEVREALRRLQASAMRSGRIIDQVRRFVTRSGPRREPFDPHQVVGEVAEILAAEADRRGVSLRIDTAPGLPWLCGDPVQVQQVLVNLARNAFDALAQAQTSEAWLVMTTRPAPDGGVEFAVEDNGEGIPREHLAQVFDAYFSTRAGGMGMGLAICRTIVEAHHGRLAVESEPGIRTTFRFRLPSEPPE